MNDTLNALLDMSTAEEDLVYQITHEVFNVTGPASYTIGVSGTFNTARPTRIRAAVSLAANSAAQPVRIVSAEQFAQVEDRTAAGVFADVLACDYANPIATIYLNPAPVTGGTLELWSIKPLANFATVGDAIALPPGYLEYLKSNLAVILAPAFAGAILTPATVALAQSTKAGLAKLYRQTLGDPLEAAEQSGPGPRGQGPGA